MRIIVVSLLLAFASLARAQSVFEGDLAEASSKLTALMVQVERTAGKSSAQRSDLQRELLAVVKTLHRIQEDASRADLELISKNHAPDHQLVRTASVAASLGLADDLASYYLDTNDSAIWMAAVATMQTARKLQTAP